MSAAHTNPPIKAPAKKKATKKVAASPDNKGLDQMIKDAVATAVKEQFKLLTNPAGAASDAIHGVSKGAGNAVDKTAGAVGKAAEKGVKAGLTGAFTGLWEGFKDSFKGPGTRLAYGVGGVLLMIFALIRFTAPVTVPVAETVGAGAVAGRVARGAARVAK